MLLWKNNRWGISVAAAASKFSSRPKRSIIQSRRRDGSMEFKWIRSSKNQKSKAPPASMIPICISTHRSDIDIEELRDLYGSCNHSCHRLSRSRSGRVEEEMDLNKLRIALTHSSVVLSVFCNRNGDLGFFERLVPVTPNSGQLVGFGRAVSDVGLTASIYDVMVSPSLRGLGIGRLIVERIVRILTVRGIYDIAALCSEQESLFFEACGFGDDNLGSTTMMYTILYRKMSDLSVRFLQLQPLLTSHPYKEKKPIWVEVCLVSARGLRRSPSLWKLQWFAVGWIDPANKYCTKIDASGNANPVWKTKFASLMELDDSNLQDMALQVEIYSRDPIFLRERLKGTATVALKEFLSNYNSSSKNLRSRAEQAGSYKLRKKNSNKPQGFVDISIRISEEREEHSTSYLGDGEGHVLAGHRIDGGGGGSVQGPGAASFQHPVNQSQINSPHPMPNYSNTPTFYQPGVGPSSYQPPLHPPSSYNNSNVSLGGPSHEPVARPGYQPLRTSTPPPPPPPSNVGYVPTLLPRTDHGTGSYLNMPTSSSTGAGGQGPRPPGFAMGVGTGAIAAGALIFGDDFMSGFDIPGGLPDPTLTISTDSPF